MALQLASVPILLMAWGPLLLGQWLVLTTISAYLQTADFGLITVANNRVDALCAARQFEEASKVHRTANRLLVGVIALLGLVSTAAVAAFQAEFRSLFPSFTAVGLFSVFAIVVMDALLSLTINHYSALFRTVGKYHWSINVQTFSRTSSAAAMLVAAAATGSVLIAATAGFTVRAAGMVILLLMLKRIVTWPIKSVRRLKPDETVKLVRSSTSFMLLPISNAFYLHITVLVLAATYNPLVVAAYSTMRTFTRLIPQFTVVAGRAFWSEFAQAHGRGDARLLTRMSQHVSWIAVILSAGAVTGYLMFGKPLYMFWTANKLPFDQTLFALLVVHAALLGVLAAIETFVLATNAHGRYALTTFLLSAAQVGTGILLIDQTGPEVFPVAGVIATAILIGVALGDRARLLRQTPNGGGA